VVEVETPTASPFASSLLFGLRRPPTCTRATRPTPSAARPRCSLRPRAAAASCSARRSCASSSNPRLEQVELDPPAPLRPPTRADLARRAGRRPAPRATSPAAEAADRVLRGLDPAAMLTSWSRTTGRCDCASVARSAGSPPTDAGLYSRRVRRRGAQRAARGLHGRRRGAAGEARRALLRAPTGPSPRASCASATLVDPTSALTTLERAGDLVRGELRPSGSEREWCDPEVLRRLRPRLAGRAAQGDRGRRPARAGLLPAELAGRRPSCPPAAAGVDRLREVLVPLQGMALPADVWERDVLPRRCGAYSPTWLDQLCGQRRGSCGSARARSVATPGAWRCTSATTSKRSGRRPTSPSGRTRPSTKAAARAPDPGAVLLHRPPWPSWRSRPSRSRRRLWDLVVGGRGTPTTRGRRCARRASPWPAPSGRANRSRPGRRFGTRRTGSQAKVQGRWFGDHVALPCGRRAWRPPAHAGRAAARALWHRHPRAGAGGGHPGGFSILYGRPGPARDAGRVPARLLRRGPGRRAVRAARRGSSGCAPQRGRGGGRADRAGRHRPRSSPTAPRCHGPSATTRPGARGARPAPTSSSPGAEPVLYGRARRQGHRRPRRARRCAHPPPALEALRAVRHTRGAAASCPLERVDGEPVVGSPWEAQLIELGFRAGPAASSR